jgi:hypothetical protein
MLFFANRSRVSLSCLRPAAFVRCGWWLGAAVAILTVTGAAIAAEQADGDFGKDIQLAPFVVNGKSLSISIHARTKADRRYAENFAEDVVEIAYETLGHSTGRGLVIVGAKGEPHPVVVFRKFQAMVRAGQIDPSLTESAGRLDTMLKKLEEKLKIDEDPGKPTGITFDTFMPALPLPLEGVASKLYQLAWSEGFDDARIEQKLKTLTRADLSRDGLNRYDWVFYVPPQSVMSAVFKDMLNKGMKAQKMGLFKRAAVRSAVFVFNPAVRKGFDAVRKGMLFMTILRAEGAYNEGDIDALVRVYVRELMPDLKPGSGNERRRALAAIEKQKIENAEYAKDPFVKPARLATADPAAYAAFEGEYTAKPPETTHRFKREGDSFQWNYKNGKPQLFFPAGDRLLVNEDGSMTIRFLVDATGTVTGVEERWVRRRQTVARKS